MANLTFLLDEHVPSAIDKALQRREFDVTTVQRLGMRGYPDNLVLQRASIETRVVVTFDDDYLRLHHEGNEHAGIAFWPGDPNAIGSILRSLMSMNERRTAEQMRNWVEYL